MFGSGFVIWRICKDNDGDDLNNLHDNQRENTNQNKSYAYKLYLLESYEDEYSYKECREANNVSCVVDDWCPFSSLWTFNVYQGEIFL